MTCRDWHFLAAAIALQGGARPSGRACLRELPADNWGARV